MRPNRRSKPRRTQDFDDTDRQILAILEADGRRPTAEIARAVGLTGPGTAERISRMRDKGIIKGFTVRLDHGRLGLHVSAFVEFDPHSNADGSGIAAVAGHPAVRSCFKVTGPAMLMLVINARDGDDLHKVLLDFAKHGTTRTAVILSSELAEMPLFAERPRDIIAALLRSSSSKAASIS